MELDLTQLMTWGKTIVGAILTLIAAFTAGPPIVKGVIAKVKSATGSSPEKKSTEPVIEGGINSDRLPPVGFEEHVKTILGAAPFADSDTRLKYLSNGLTEAQTLKAEVNRMGELKSPAPTKEVKS